MTVPTLQLRCRDAKSGGAADELFQIHVPAADISGSPNAQRSTVVEDGVFPLSGVLFVDTGLGFYCEHSTSTGLNLGQGLCLWELVIAILLLSHSHWFPS